MINASLGFNAPAPPQVLANAMDVTRQRGVLVVAAAGNETEDVDGVAEPLYPCKFGHEDLICVAAIAKDDSLASFSNFGTSSVDVGAPGEDTLAADIPREAVYSQNFDGTFPTWRPSPRLPTGRSPEAASGMSREPALRARQEARPTARAATTATTSTTGSACARTEASI